MTTTIFLHALTQAEVEQKEAVERARQGQAQSIRERWLVMLSGRWGSSVLFCFDEQGWSGKKAL